MDWHSSISGFKAYLSLERSLSKNSVDAYISDVQKLSLYCAQNLDHKSPAQLTMQDIESFIHWLFQFGFLDRTQARILSGVKAFYKFLLIEEVIVDDPTDLIEGPKLIRKIPDVLNVEEIEAIINSIDLSGANGHRNRAIIETLYACGLRVTELTELKLSNIYEDEGVIKVIGKGNKERLVPFGEEAIHHIHFYLQSYRNQLPKVKGHEDFVFLNRFGKKISRISIFEIVKEAARRAGITKIISPHTFRHSFATHLVEGGANLRAVQEMLGHESITTTEIYTHLDTEFLRDTILRYHPSNKKK
ncbi:MAG: site-specific tyrosine recombinase XerD [Bacteroidota bacterium]|nr:site-specific tyrosine recombinase XerD [Bacteroidota bacterium]